mmetsp:Transcript_3262/g.4364  ORF Transcript_3262/g.4364 Transcript_3262/m.4364 type:complete len:120 (+) Transcript_3262:97-456(+)
MDIDNLGDFIEAEQQTHELGCLCCVTALDQMTGGMYGGVSKYGKFNSVLANAMADVKLPSKKNKNSTGTLKTKKNTATGKVETESKEEPAIKSGKTPTSSASEQNVQGGSQVVKNVPSQ